MKKAISLILSLELSLSAVLCFSGTVYSAKAEEKSINRFIEDGINLIRENDAEKELVPETVEEEAINDTDETAAYRARAIAKSQKSTVDSSAEEFSDTAFQTCRLLVKASKTPDKLNSIGMASGFKDWYIVQFETEEDAKKAYEYYSQDQSVLCVSPDLVISISFDEESDGKQPEINANEKPERLNSWGSIATGLYDVKDYIVSHPEYNREITIGVVDTGIDLDNEFVKDRLIRTYFNSSSEGEENSEYQYYAHGTMVTSVIVDNTPENVKIKVYKTGNVMPTSALAVALIKAVEESVDLINCSFAAWAEVEILEDALNYCFENDIPVFASAGNDEMNILRFNNWPAYDERSITVAASNDINMPSDFTSYGSVVDLMAPGDEIPVSYGADIYSNQSGTSFSSPMTASLFADMMILFPSYSKKEIEHMLYSNAVPSDLFYDCGLFGYGVIDAIGSAGLERNTAPEFSIPDGKYIDEIEVEITAEPGCEIYYTLDGSFPSKESGIHYVEPVKIADDCTFLKAVAYGNDVYRSECTKSLYRLQRVGTDDMFEISDEGEIISYTGDVYDLIIPETINGITVTGIDPEVFSDSEIVGVSFPDTLDTVSQAAFLNCDSLMFADGNNIIKIERDAFKFCGLYFVEFPAVQEIGSYAFAGNYTLSGICFPECKSLGSSSFGGCRSLRKADLPKLEVTNGGSFDECAALTEVNLPSWLTMSTSEMDEIEHLKVLDLPSVKKVERSMFGTVGSPVNNTHLERLELSNVEVIRSIPFGLYKDRQKPITMVIPSTFTTLKTNNTYYKEINPLFVYGTRGTYTEEWANEYENIEFIEISQETAVINDLPDEFYDYMRYLYADVVGFNRTYQWYGSYSDRNTGGTPIEGANERKFVPKENEQYPYYYCVVTSTDVGYEPIELRTGASRYMEFNGETPNADYSALDEILATVPEDLSIYTDETVSALNEIINGINRNLDVTEQATVDEYVEAISNALSDLKLKEHMVSFIVDNESVLSYELEYGSEITDIPPNPDKTGYTFSKWNPDIPPAMPNNSLAFTAEFEPVTYYASFMVDGEEIEKVPFTVESESISEPGIPVKEGYTGKWSEYIIAASDITIYAEYIINEYTVNFVADDKTVKSETVEYGSPIEVPDNPQKDGYIFKEWLPKVPETMPAEDMTFYAVFEEEKPPEIKPDISIKNFVNSQTVDYRTTITFTAAAGNLPEGATIVWYKDGQRAGTGEKLTVTDAREAFTVQARIVDESGIVLNVTETELVKVKTDLFSRIIAFFRMLFGKLPVIEQ